MRGVNRTQKGPANTLTEGARAFLNPIVSKDFEGSLSYKLESFLRSQNTARPAVLFLERPAMANNSQSGERVDHKDAVV